MRGSGAMSLQWHEAGPLLVPWCASFLWCPWPVSVARGLPRPAGMRLKNKLSKNASFPIYGSVQNCTIYQNARKDKQHLITGPEAPKLLG